MEQTTDPRVSGVSNFAALRALISGYQQGVALVEGGGSPGDGLGGPFWFDPASTLTDDSRDALNPASNPATGRWRHVSQSGRYLSPLPSVAALRSLGSAVTVSDGDLRYLKGYYGLNDGGEGPVYYDASLVAKSFSASASTDTFTASGHGFTNGQELVLTGISTSTGFVTAATTNTFKLSTTLENAMLATPVVINLTADGSGTANLADNGGTVFVDTAGRRWRRLIENETVNLRAFGARGNYFTDDTVQTRRAIAACLDLSDPRSRRAIYKLLPPIGAYRITDTLHITAAGLHIEGQGVADYWTGSSFLWFGANDRPMFDTQLRLCKFTNFMIWPEASLLCGIRLANYTAVNNTYWAPSRNIFENLNFLNTYGSSGPFFTYDFEITGSTAKGSQDNNNDLNVFRDCQFYQYTEAAVHMEACSQSFNNKFYSTDAAGFGSNGKYVIKQEQLGGSFLWYDGAGGYSSVADFYLSQVSNPSLIQGWNSENSARLVDSGYTGTNSSWPLTIRNCRWESNSGYIASDGNFIRFGYTGPLTIEENFFAARGTTPPLPTIRLDSNPGAAGVPMSASISHKRNYYEHEDTLVTAPIVVNAGTWHIEDEGNIAMNWAEGLRRPIPSKRNSIAYRNNVSVTLTLADAERQVWNTTLTANRTVTLPTVYWLPGVKFRIVRNAATPGAFTLAVGSLATIPANTRAWAEIESDGSAWVLTGYGTLP